MKKSVQLAMVLFFVLFFAYGLCFAWPIPDTGQTKCYDNEKEIPCPQPGEPFYGQDGNYTINPPSYTKLDANGNDLPDSATNWMMVRDNVTGLIWEVKQNKDNVKDYANPHDADNQYTWYDSNPATNGGDAGTPGDGTDTEDFINALNDENFGGYSDWRMPIREELRSIIDYGKFGPGINENVFPNIGVSENEYVYWSSDTYPADSGLAWRVEDGNSHNDPKSYSYKVRAVHGNKHAAFNHFVNNNNSTVTDIGTGLMWQQLSENSKKWEESLNICETKIINGFDDWRMPTVSELSSISDVAKYAPAIDIRFFPDTIIIQYWTSTTNARYVTSVWPVSTYRGGQHSSVDKTLLYNFRCVRGGQNQIPGHLVILSPRQASVWEKGSTVPIQWDTANISGNVKILISYEGGKPDTFQTIAENTPNDGEYDWKTGEISSFNCMLRIEPLSDPSKGTVQGLFTIGNFIIASADSFALEEPADPDSSGQSKTFRIMLTGDPGGDTVLRLYSSNPGEFSLSPASVTLNSANWNTGAEVTLTPEYDGIPDNDQTASVIVSTVSEYAAFQAKEVSAVRVTVRDTSTAVTAQSVFPAYGTAGSPLAVTVRGTNFSSTTPVYIYTEGGTPAAITPVTVMNETTLQVTVPAQSAGNYHLKVSESVLKNALTFVTASALNTKKAIIVAGSGPYFDNSLWNATEKCVNKAYQTLAFQGYSAENIRFLSRKLWADVTGNGENDIDADATKANLENAVKTWAANNTDELLIYMTGPGGDGSFQFGSNAAPEILTAETLDSWLDTLQSAASCKVIVIYDACQSGSFLSPLAGENRILITSADSDERAWFLDDGELSFSFRLFDSLFHNADLIESFKTAKNNTGSVQMPLIDWDGDGMPDTLSAGRSEPETVIIGRGRAEDTAPPEIGTASANPEILVSQTSSVLSASGITADNGLSRVWARIIPPAENYVSSSAPVIVLPTVKLLDQNDGTYQNTYEEFTQQGFYNIFVYANDLKDFQSLPVILTVNQTNGEKADPGDVNADGEITLADALLVLKLMSGKNVTPAPGSDINADDKTELANSVFILQKVADMR
ncbi:MAG: DUF1566 domain-containing protein [Desulfococcaceae bacterium]